MSEDAGDALSLCKGIIDMVRELNAFMLIHDASMQAAIVALIETHPRPSALLERYRQQLDSMSEHQSLTGEHAALIFGALERVMSDQAGKQRMD